MLQKIDASYEISKRGEEIGNGEKSYQFLSPRADLRQHEKDEENEDGTEAGQGTGNQRDVAGNGADAKADLARGCGAVELLRTKVHGAGDVACIYIIHLVCLIIPLSLHCLYTATGCTRLLSSTLLYRAL